MNDHAEILNVRVCIIAAFWTQTVIILWYLFGADQDVVHVKAEGVVMTSHDGRSSVDTEETQHGITEDSTSPKACKSYPNIMVTNIEIPSVMVHM